MFTAAARRAHDLERRFDGMLVAWSNRQDMIGTALPEAPVLGMPQYAGRPTADCHDIPGIDGSWATYSSTKSGWWFAATATKARRN